MRVIRILKSFNAGKKLHYLVVYDDSASNDEVEFLVQEWADSDPAGQNYGYQLDWDYVEDRELTRQILNKEASNIDKKMDKLKSNKDKISEFLSI